MQINCYSCDLEICRDIFDLCFHSVFVGLDTTFMAMACSLDFDTIGSPHGHSWFLRGLRPLISYFGFCMFLPI